MAGRIDRSTDLKFVDINKDDKIDLEDRTNLGDPHPDFTFGFNIGFDYKNFDFGEDLILFRENLMRESKGLCIRDIIEKMIKI